MRPLASAEASTAAWRISVRCWTPRMWSSVGLAERDAERVPEAVEQVGLDAAAPHDLGGGVALRAALEHPFDGQQRQPALARRGAQLLELDAVGLEALEQRQARIAVGAVEAREQSLCLEVGGHRRRA
jgi:hypothetical protein